MRAARLEKPAKLRGHLLYLAETGKDPEEVLAGSGVSLESIIALEPIDSRKMGELFELLDARTPEDFAIRCGLATKFQYMGVLGYRLINSDTVRDLIETWVQYSVVIGYPLASDLVVREDSWEFRFWPRYPLSEPALRLCMETTLAGAAPALSALSGHSIEVLRYGFPFPRPARSDHYELLGAATLRFDQPAGHIAGRLNDLSKRMAVVDSEAKAITEDYCKKRLSVIVGEDAVVDRLKDLFASQPGELPSAAKAAHLLGCSERTLHRRLASVDSSYQRVLDLYRRDQAFQMLRDAVELKVIAYRLGYQDTGSFRRAFRQWTGMPPSRWQKQNPPSALRSHPSGSRANRRSSAFKSNGNILRFGKV